MINFRLGTKIALIGVCLSTSLSACKHTSQGDSSSVTHRPDVTEPKKVTWKCEFLYTNASTVGWSAKGLYVNNNRLQVKDQGAKVTLCIGPATGYEGVPGGLWIWTDDGKYFTEKGNNTTPQWEPLSVGNRHQIWYKVSVNRQNDLGLFYIHNWWSINGINGENQTQKEGTIEGGTNQCLAVFDSPSYRNCGLVSKDSYVHLVDNCPVGCMNAEFFLRPR